MNPTFKKIWNAFTSLLVILAVILTLLLAGARLVGLRVFSVLSPSMEPAFPVGSLIYVKKVDPAKVKPGDPITFVLNEDLAVATHRVVRVEKKIGENGRYFLYYTKGDANETEDGAPTRSENLLGIPVFAVPKLGRAAYYIQRPPGLYAAVAAGAFLLLLVFLPDLFGGGKKKKTRAEDKPSAHSDEEG